MTEVSTNKKSANCRNKHQHKLIVLISTLQYTNKTHKKYTQQNILYYYNKNLKRNGQNPVKLKTLQKYLYKLEKEIKVTTNYYKHLGVNCGTEIYYKLNFSKKECYQKINQFFKEKKETRFQKRVNNHFKNKFPLRGSVNSEVCLSNTNNNIKEERKERDNPIKKFQIIKYFNKCNFLSKKNLFLLLNLNIDKDTLINVFKIIKRYEIELTKNKKIFSNKSYFKEKQNKLKEILKNKQKEFEKNGYNIEQLEINFQRIYEKYKNKPHFIIEYQKYNDLSIIKRKLEKSIELKKENPQKNYEHIRTNIFNILIDRLKNTEEIEVLKPIIKNYLNSKKKLEYNKVFGSYYYELLEMLENGNNTLKLKELSKKVI
ncbi:plasmid maintenance protein (plasmid) [Borreliella yangtzensis]|uniref:plasmid maintenance protein n=1 Tax=Borreliella yangtzensis TaxID=683292 RepID=UPI003B21F6FF